MHEASLAAHMLAIAAQAAGPRRDKVRTVTVAVGEMAGVMADSLAFAFDAIKGSMALEKAELKIQTVPVCVRCRRCGQEYAPHAFPYVCPRCEEHGFDMVQGEELFVKELEMEP